MSDLVARFETAAPCTYPSPAAANAFAAWPKRRGVLLSVSIDGVLGWGEASPLPGYSPDTEAQAHKLLVALPGVEVRVDETAPWASIQELAYELMPDERAPAARFAVESALLDAVATVTEIPPEKILADQRPRIVSQATTGSSALSQRGVAEVLTQLDSAIADGLRAQRMGARALKLKVGRPGLFIREQQMVTDLTRQLVDHPLRIDANGAFSDISAIETLAKMGLEFFEEPGDWDLIEPVKNMVRWAMDESLRQPNALDMLASLADVLGALVVKPAVLGGLSAAITWANRGDALGIPTVVSHLFDGPVAAKALRALANALPSWGPAHGLGLQQRPLELIL
ncbi:MAG: hypothetical protein KTR25_11830 [Myxococcales bacterium]|nr:hypothetical protein [Myxococcales bacterium]